MVCQTPRPCRRARPPAPVARPPSGRRWVRTASTTGPPGRPSAACRRSRCHAVDTAGARRCRRVAAAALVVRPPTRRTTLGWRLPGGGAPLGRAGRPACSARVPHVEAVKPRGGLGKGDSLAAEQRSAAGRCRAATLHSRTSSDRVRPRQSGRRSPKPSRRRRGRTTAAAAARPKTCRRPRRHRCRPLPRRCRPPPAPRGALPPPPACRQPQKKNRVAGSAATSRRDSVANTAADDAAGCASVAATPAAVCSATTSIGSASAATDGERTWTPSRSATPCAAPVASRAVTARGGHKGGEEEGGCTRPRVQRRRRFERVR